MMIFSNKVAIVTGGTSGIGRAAAIAYAQQGANVVVAGRRSLTPSKEPTWWSLVVDRSKGKRQSK